MTSPNDIAALATIQRNECTYAEERLVSKARVAIRNLYGDLIDTPDADNIARIALRAAGVLREAE